MFSHVSVTVCRCWTGSAVTDMCASPSNYCLSAPLTFSKPTTSPLILLTRSDTWPSRSATLSTVSPARTLHILCTFCLTSEYVSPLSVSRLFWTVPFSCKPILLCSSYLEGDCNLKMTLIQDFMPSWRKTNVKTLLDLVSSLVIGNRAIIRLWNNHI